MKIILLTLLSLILPTAAFPQAAAPRMDSVSLAWTADRGDGTYRNPVLYADYSDPDVIRIGDTFYLVASSFNESPGLPILESHDLVNWQIVAHAFTQQMPVSRYETPQHGSGAWAPALRYHSGEFYLFYPDPDYGIYMIKAQKVTGPWSTPLLIKAAPGWIDPCPFWDEDGNAYLVNALAASRSGVKGVVLINRMAPDGSSLLGDASILIDGHNEDPTLEGPKIYKRDGYYYVFAPAGGVPQGWQVVYRSKRLYGPYQRKVVLAKGNTAINGPHQGAWVNTPAGEDWFLHFQDQGPYGRVVHLEPMKWQDDWPIIGAPGTDGVGEPVLTYRKPKVAGPVKMMSPADSDEFNGSQIGLQWQWEANPKPNYAFSSKALGSLRLIAITPPKGETNLYNMPNVLLQKLPASHFIATAKVIFMPRFDGEETGLVMLGQSYAYIGLRKTTNGLEVRQVERRGADNGGVQTESKPARVASNTLYLRATVQPGAVVTFSYSEDGNTFRELGTPFQAVAGRWVGARIGLFAVGSSLTGELGYADYDWFRITQ